MKLFSYCLYVNFSMRVWMCGITLVRHFSCLFFSTMSHYCLWACRDACNKFAINLQELTFYVIHFLIFQLSVIISSVFFIIILKYELGCFCFSIFQLVFFRQSRLRAHVFFNWELISNDISDCCFYIGVFFHVLWDQ